MRKWILPWLLLATLWVSQPVYALDEKASTAQLEQLRRDVAQLQQRIAAREKRRQDEQVALAEAERAINRVTAELRAIDSDLQRLDSNMEGLQSQRAILETELEERRSIIFRLLREQYRQGKQSRLRLLLKQEDPEKMGRMMRYYDYVNAELNLQLKAYQEKLDSLGSTRSAIGSTEAEIFSRRALLANEQEQLKQAHLARQTALAALSKEQQEEQQRLESLRRDQQELEALISGINKSLDSSKLVRDSQEFASLRGQLPWPIQGRLLRNYGSKRSGVAYEGLLIAGQAASEVRAVHHGRVVFSEWLRGYGLVMILDHGGGYMSLYGHNETLLYEPGDWVSAGQVIATVGNSGGNEQIGLYFAIRHQGKPVNPSQWLSRP